MKYQDPVVVAPADGMVRGDDGAFPNRGTRSGMVGMGAPYGADISQGATNSLGSIAGACASDAMDQCCPPGDGRFSSSGHSSPRHGRGMGSAAMSDDMMDVTPGDEGMPGDRD